MAEKDDKFIKLMKSALVKFDTEDFEGAIADYTAAIESKPADKSRLAEAYNDRGFTQNELGRREEAIADYGEARRLCDEAIEIDSENARAWYNRGFAKNGLSRYEEAIADFDEAIRFDSKYAFTWCNRGLAKNKLGRPEEAIADFDEAIRLKPKNKNMLSSTYNNRGLVKDNLGRHEEAIKDFDEAIRLKPKNAPAWNNRGSAKDKLGRHEEAIKDFDEAIRLEPEKATAWNNRGSAKNELGRHEEAIKDFDEAIRLEPENGKIWNNRGAAKRRLDHYEEAIADYTEGIRLDPENAIIWNNRSSAKAYLEDFDSAIRDVEEARRLSPDDPDVLNNRAAIKAEKSARDVVEERIGSLKTGTEEAENQAKKYKWIERINRIVAYFLVLVLIGTISFLVAVLIVPNLPSEHFSKLLSEYFPKLMPKYSPELKPIDIKILINLLPLISIIIIITSPLVWLIRLLITAANKAELMQAEYSTLAYVEKRIFFYFAKDDTDKGKEVRADYIKSAMTNSPADKLLAFQSKTSAISPSSVQNVAETIESKINNKKTR